MCGGDLHIPLTLRHNGCNDQTNGDDSAVRQLFSVDVPSDHMSNDPMVDDPVVTSSVSLIELPLPRSHLPLRVVEADVLEDV